MGCTRYEIATLQGFSPIYALTFSPNNRILASGSMDGTIIIWDLETKLEIHRFIAHKAVHRQIKSLEFSPDGKWLASSAEDRKLRLWKLE